MKITLKFRRFIVYGSIMTWFFLYILLAQPCPWNVVADVNIPSKSVHGRISGPVSDQKNMYFLNYAAKLETDGNPGDIAKFRVYPRYFEKGSLKIKEARCQNRHLRWSFESTSGIEKGVIRFDTSPCNSKDTLIIDFQLVLPVRFGPLNCMDGRCILAAPWYPIPVKLKDINKPVSSWRHCLSLKSSSTSYFLGDRIYNKRTSICGDAEFFPFAGGKDYQVTKVGKYFTVYHYNKNSLFYKYFKGVRIDRLLEFLKKINVPDVFGNGPVNFIEAPLREDLAMSLPLKGILFSNKTFSIVGHSFFRKFHEQTLIKTLLETVLHNKLKNRENSTFLSFVSRIISMHYLSTEKHINSLLKTFEWIPQIDGIIKNPRMEFKNSFVTGPQSSDERRDDFRRWNNSLPTGEFIYHKFIDYSGKTETSVIISRYLNGSDSFLKTLNNYFGINFNWFFNTWLSNPKINYRLKSVKIKKNGGKSFVHIKVEKNKIDVKENVTVCVHLEGGEKRMIVWDGTGLSHTFKIHITKPVLKVVLDPDERLTEYLPPGRKTPRYDNHWPSPGWRFLFSGVLALFNVTELLSRIYVDADLLPRDDLGYRLNFLVFRNEIIDGAAGLSFLKYFGRNIYNTRLAWRFDAGVQAGISREFEVENGNRAWFGNLFTSLIWNTREDFVFPAKKGWGMLMASWNMFAWPEDRMHPSDRLDLTATAAHYFRLPFGCVLATYFHGGLQVGSIKSEVELMRLSGPNLLQGYVTDEFKGRMMATGALELRHIIISRTDFSLGGLVNLSRISGALYAGIGGITGGMDGSLTSNPRWGASIGYGIRLQGVWFGIYEGVINLQAAVPLHRYETTKEPFVFFISLEPVF